MGTVRPAAVAMAARGTHEKVIGLIGDLRRSHGLEVAVDIGAGQGHLSAAIQGLGLTVSACDVDTAQFRAPGIDCRACAADGSLPYADATFDLAVAVELLEHIDGHGTFLSEVSRILKPGGLFLFTTPNILSFKSRWRFLLSGEFYSFGLLKPFTRDPAAQHITPFTLNRYMWQLSQHEMEIVQLATDKWQRSSLLLGFLAPLVWLRAWTRPAQERTLSRTQNSAVALFGRKLLIVAAKTARSR